MSSTILVAMCQDCPWTFPKIRRRRWSARDVTEQARNHRDEAGHSTYTTSVVPDDRPVLPGKPSSSRTEPFVARCAGHPERDENGLWDGTPYYPIEYEDRDEFVKHVLDHPEHQPPKLKAPKVARLKKSLVPPCTTWNPNPFGPGTGVTWMEGDKRQFGQVWSLAPSHANRWVVPIAADGSSLPPREIAVRDMEPASAYGADALLPFEESEA